MRIFQPAAFRHHAPGHGGGLLFSVVAALFAAASLFYPGSCLAAERLTLDEVYRMAIANHEAVGIAGEGVSQAESNLGKATSRLLPNLTAEGAFTRYSERKRSASGLILQPDDSSSVNVKLTQPLYSGGKEWNFRRQAGMLIERSRAGLELSKESVVRLASRAYFGVLKAQKEVEIKSAALKRAYERRKVAVARFKVGEVTKSAVLRAEAEVAGAEAETTRAGGNFTDAKSLLRRVTGYEGKDIAVEEPKTQPAVDSDVDTLVKKAFESRLDYKQSMLDQNVASEGISYAKGNFLPSLRLEGLATYREQNPETSFLLKDSVSASVILTYPIFEGFLRKSELSEARSKYREAELRRLGLKRDIEVEVRDAFNNVESVRAVIDSYRKQLEFAEEDYKMVFEQFRYGLATTVDVIDADTVLISAERSLMNAAYDLELAKVELKYSLGVLLDDVKLNNTANP
ncbi:MAG: TolC family protein [Deltaproteobacteria bacterium]|nr:TolC family protein [Deltaproteobacteria bacterium]